MNVVTITGRVTKDLELKQTQSGVAVMQFSLAVRKEQAKEGQPDTDFINCIAYKQTAEFMSKYIKKGDGIEVSGRLNTRNYDDKDGKKVYITEVVANTVNFGIGSKGEKPVESKTPVKDPFDDIF